jgi:hypothetical protein
LKDCICPVDLVDTSVPSYKFARYKDQPSP